MMTMQTNNILHYFVYLIYLFMQKLLSLSLISKKSTGCSKSHCAKVWAYCSAPGHLIRKISSGMFQKSSSFKEYTRFCEIGVHFFKYTFIFHVFRPLAVPGSHPL